MSGNTFTLTVGEGGSIDVSVLKVVDSTFSDLVRLYIQSIRLKTSLSSTSRVFRVAISQPATFPTGYTGTVAVGQSTWLAFSAATDFVSSSSDADPHDGAYTFASNAGSLIGTQQVQPRDAPIPCVFTLETSTDAGANWTVVPFTGTGTNYTFDIGDGTNRVYDTKGVENNYDSGDGGANAVLQNNQATLYYKQNYNTIYPSAQLTSGNSAVDIAGSQYIAYVDTVGTLVTSGNDFTLYLPNSANSDGPAGVTAVQDRQMIIIPPIEANLMDLGLSTNGLQGPSAGTGAPVSKNVERGDTITFHAVIPWSQVTIDSIEKTENNRTAVNDTDTSTYYGAFDYQGTTYSLSIVNGLGGAKNVKMSVQTSYGSTVTTTIHRIWIRPGVPVGGPKAL